MGAKRFGNIDYENISVEDLAKEVVRRAKSVIQSAVTRYKEQGREDLVQKIQQARKLAQIIKLQHKLHGNK